jgi:hypothetical protein
MATPTPARGFRLRRAALVSALLVAGCATPPHRDVTQVGLHRQTPTGAFAYLKAMVAANQVEAEWHAFSPGFKRRLAEQAGRHVDLADYSHARATIASNSTAEIGMLLQSEVVSEQRLSDDVAVLTVRSGNRQATPRFVRLTTWALRVKGESDPVAEFVPRAADVVAIEADGSVQLRVTPSGGTSAFLRDIPRDRVEGFEVGSEWYLDDFGGIESAVGTGLRGGAAPPPAPVPTRGGGGAPAYRPPSSTPPPTMPAPPPAPSGGLGSPG